jgi:DNA-binding Lrp family transcriptional regulator
MDVNALEAQLLNGFQHEFPLCERPFAVLAELCGSDEASVIDTLCRLQSRGAISRVGPVFGINRIGVSTLAAMAVPEAELDRVAELVNGFDAVNHNYAREHRYNLWFVATAADRVELNAVLADIAARSGYAVMDLPMLRDHHIDLGFQLGGHLGQATAEPFQARSHWPLARRLSRVVDEQQLDALIAQIQTGLELQPQPFLTIAQRLDCSEEQVLDGIAALRADGRIRRFGVVVRHRELGWRANAMVVWDVPDALVDDFGERLGQSAPVTLCYQRPRRLPGWRYNLFSMLHGRDRDEVRAAVAQLASGLAAADYPHELLFSSHCYKQRGARYRS